MASYQWNKPETARPSVPYKLITVYDQANIADVDRELCEKYGIPVSDKYYCWVYNYCIELAFMSLMNLGGQYVEQQHIDKMVATLEKAKEKPSATDPENKQVDKLIDAVKHVFTKYKFEAWR